MFSALKRLTSKPEVNGTQATPPGLRIMEKNLQKKFSRGIHYNSVKCIPRFLALNVMNVTLVHVVKIILKGDRNSGKTCLFRRLQGLPFQEEYVQTEQLEAANIQWNYKMMDDIVKVEVWDVVDKAKRKKNVPNKLKIENRQAKNGQDDTEDAQEAADYCLDASFLDVYKNTNGVIFVFDITKNWTFDYVKREIPNVPSHIPILILANHRDMGHHRAIAMDTVHYFIESLERDEGSAEIRCAESSMRNGFGLKYVHRFFNLPFLQLQRETLLKQLQTNREEHHATVQELDFYHDDYDSFIEGLTAKRRQVADSLGSNPQKISLAEAQAIAHEKAMKEGNIAAAIALGSKPSIIIESANSKPNVPTTSIGKTLQESAASSLASTTTAAGGSANIASSSNSPSNNNKVNHQNSVPASSPSLATKPPSITTGNGSASKNISNMKPSQSSSNSVVAVGGAVDVDDFVPDEESNHGIDKSFFLEDSASSRSNNQVNGGRHRNNNLHLGGTSDEEDEKEAYDANPLVASFVEDVVPEAYTSPVSSNVVGVGSSGIAATDSTVKSPGAPSSSSKFCILSSSEEELSEERLAEKDGLNSNFKLNLNLSQLPASNLDLDLGIFLKDENVNDALSEFSTTTTTKHVDSSSAKEKKSSKKASSSSSGNSVSSKHHKKSKHKKSSSSSKKDRHQRDLDDFLNDTSHKPDDVDLNAYEAL